MVVQLKPAALARNINKVRSSDGKRLKKNQFGVTRELLIHTKLIRMVFLREDAEFCTRSRIATEFGAKNNQRESC